MMEKDKRWKPLLILTVLLLTIYNVLPTVFYYTKPLRAPIEEKRAENIVEDIVSRVNSLEKFAKEWLQTFSKNLGIKTKYIKINNEDPQLVDVSFYNSKDMNLFKNFLPDAGSRISFIPAQLSLIKKSDENTSNILTVQRHIGTKIDPEEVNDFFTFAFKRNSQGQITKPYRNMINDRIIQIALSLGGTSASAKNLAKVIQQEDGEIVETTLITISEDIVEYVRIFDENNSIAKRYFSSFTQGIDDNKAIYQLISKLSSLKQTFDHQEKELLQEQEQLEKNEKFLDPLKQQLISKLHNQKHIIAEALKILKKHTDVFSNGSKPLTRKSIISRLENDDEQQTISITENNPFISQLIIDWSSEKIKIELHNDILTLLEAEEKTSAETYLKDKINQVIIQEIAHVSHVTNEKITPSGNMFVIDMGTLTNSKSFLLLNLDSIAKKKMNNIQKRLNEFWVPKYIDFKREVFPIWNYSTFKKLPIEDRSLGLVLYAPILEEETPPAGFRLNSIYVIARGLGRILMQYKESPRLIENQDCAYDFQKLSGILQQDGFFGYLGSSYGLESEYSQDYIFELNDYYSNFINATRENFVVKGSKLLAVLEFGDVEQRIITDNLIRRKIHEDLLKWRNERHAAETSRNSMEKYLVPPVSQNILWQNLRLNTYQYFHGDDRKIIHWGLDLAGGKSICVGLKNQNNQPVTSNLDLREGCNELSQRVNKMGVSEVKVRVEGDHIVLDFPGKQNLSASDLITASTMTFHIVNEKFKVHSSDFNGAVNGFLQEVWNEAVVTNRKSSEEINEIAWRLLGGDNEKNVPQSENAKILVKNGLKLAKPDESKTVSFNDTLSHIARYRGDDFAQWHGQSHPLLVVFNNYSLEGSSLEGIHSEYNPSRGNVLVFRVKSSYGSKSKNTGNPQEDLYVWTSQFSENKIIGTPKEESSKGHGWRMAIILNDLVISDPPLADALRTGGEIHGNFSQRDVSLLASDLKAGSLTYSPHILSETSISPDLGKEERSKGIYAAVIGLFLVIGLMSWYYRFAGVVASFAVLFNLLIMWGVLQNLDAALTLPGIAGIILTIGMAVDANVLVFERVREEFAVSKRLSSALQAGYRKAYSAIIDSNLTTIIAAIILIQFNSGPIKGFAVTLIIGIVSSMFTALFMTRYFFTIWMKTKKHRQLNMMNFIKTNVEKSFLTKVKMVTLGAIMIIICGGYLFGSKYHTMLGMDFTGGYSAIINIEKTKDVNYRDKIALALENKGALPGDFEIHELNKPNILKIQLGSSMDQEGHPFYSLPTSIDIKDYQYMYEKNPRLSWLIQTLQDNGISIGKTTLKQIDSNWSTMSGQFSDSMRNQAIIALACALLFILIYLSIRFEFKYAVSALICLIHDVLITLSTIALLRTLGIDIQISTETIGALMTIIGYSLNDTIIIFDRIREDVRLNKKLAFSILVNRALNKTLSRTIMTSLTTILVLIALVSLGGDQIFDLSLTMTLGVIFGTISSLFIASPIMIYFHNKEGNKKLFHHTVVKK